jgi:exopolysaccharide biosynthesis protein
MDTGKRRLLVIFIDILLIGIGLLVYALFHHVIPREGTPIATPFPTSPTAYSFPNETEASNPLATPTSMGWSYEGFSTATISDRYSYTSKNISIKLKRHEKNGVVYFVQDIHIRNIESLKTAFAKDKYGIGFKDTAFNIAEKHNAIAAITGDYYGARDIGVVIRNGTLYRDARFRDVCVLYRNGEMKTFSKNEIDAYKELQNGAYQAWSFGPALLDNSGKPKTAFDSDVKPKNPRAAIGYYEPGHYCFVVVDGRGENDSKGMTLMELSQLMYELGCKVAYNLDGGMSAQMYFNGEIVNSPAKGGREISDIIYICENP